MITDNQISSFAKIAANNGFKWHVNKGFFLHVPWTRNNGKEYGISQIEIKSIQQLFKELGY